MWLEVVLFVVLVVLLRYWFLRPKGMPPGVIMTNGERWQNARNFLLRNLKDLGMGKTYLEDAILQEANMLVEDLKTYTGAPTPFPKSINIAVLNVVWQMVASKRYDLADEEVMSLMKLMKDFENMPALVMLCENIPWLKMFIPKFLRGSLLHEDMLNNLNNESIRLTREMVAEHRAELDPDNPRDVVDQYLVAMDSKDDIAKFFSEKDLMRNMMDLFFAAFDSTSSMLRWIILYMAKYPEVQRRVQQQIDDVVSRDTLPSTQHKSRLPVVEAMIHEVLRQSSIIPLGFTHATNSDLHLEGYFIPKGSWVFGCTVCCNEDPQYWMEPDQFNIDRFLDAEGNFSAQKEGFLPFGLGRRSCLGEALARMELYVFTAAILQNFSFSAPEGCEIDLEHDNKNPCFLRSKEQNILISLRI
nr:cytochrome P450 2L1-like isoform X2 [Procambarus clarkii]